MGYVESRRGVEGGYLLNTSPELLTVGEIIRLIDGPMDPVQCMGANKEERCPMLGRCAFLGLWDRARRAIESVYDTTTFATLIEEERMYADSGIIDYCI